MSSVIDQYVNDESRAADAYQQLGKIPPGIPPQSPLQKLGSQLWEEVPGESTFQKSLWIGSFIIWPVGTLAGTLSGAALRDIAEYAFPGHTTFAAGVDLAGNIIGGVAGDIAAYNIVAEKLGPKAASELIEKVKATLPEQLRFKFEPKAEPVPAPEPDLKQLSLPLGQETKPTVLPSGQTTFPFGQEPEVPRQISLPLKEQPKPVKLGEKDVVEEPTKRQLKNQVFKFAKETFGHAEDTDEDLEKRVKIAGTAARISKNIYTGFVNGALWIPRIAIQKITTDIINQPTQQLFRSWFIAREYGAKAGIKAFQSAMYGMKAATRDALHFAYMTASEDRAAYQADILGQRQSEQYLIETEGKAAKEGIENSSNPADGTAVWRWMHAISKVRPWSYGRRAIMSSDQFAKAISWMANMHMLSYMQALEEGARAGLSEGALIRYADARAPAILSEPTEALMKLATQNMHADTFTDQGKVISQLTGFANDHLWARLALPFVRTPMSMIRGGIQTSPYAPATEWGTMTGGSPMERSVALTKWYTGMEIARLIGDMTAAGLITGDGPTNYLAREMWPGRDHPRSFQVEGRWFSYRYMGPFADTIALTADGTEIYHMSKDPSVQSKLMEAIGGSLSNMVDNVPFMEWANNLSRLEDGMKTGNPTPFEEYIGRMASGFEPGMLRDAEQAYDPTEKITHVMGTESVNLSPWTRFGYNIVRQIGNNVPGWGAKYPPKRDWRGNPIYPVTAAGGQLTGLERFLNSVVNPFTYEGKVHPPDPVEQMMYERGISFKDIPDHIGKDPNHQVPLTPEDRDEWVVKAAKDKIQFGNQFFNQYEAMDWLRQQPDFRTASTPDQITAIHKTHEAYVKNAQDEVYNEHGYDKKVLAAQQALHQRLFGPGGKTGLPMPPMTITPYPGSPPGSAAGPEATGPLAPIVPPSSGEEELPQVPR